MARPIIIDRFQGIAPRFGDSLKLGYATIAENCDLSEGTIKPMKGALQIKADTNKYNAMYYKGAWHHGEDKSYLEWKIGSAHLLIHLVSGVPYKGSTILGQTRLGAPTVALNGAGDLTGKYNYFITTTRYAEGMYDESGPSTVSDEIAASSNQILITRPTISDGNVTYWNIYRISQESGDYQFVAQVDISETTYDDNTQDADLSGAPTTYYTSDQGNEIVFDKPLVTFDGLSTEPESGLIFGWNGSTLYWNEPGLPDAWPGFYNANFPTDIKRMIPFGGMWAVLTAKGPHRLDGTHPELLQPSKNLGKEPCIGTAACQLGKGAAYLCDSGIAVFDLTETNVITDGAFTEEWFKTNVTSTSAFMVENDNKLYLFHSDGVLVGDMRVRPIIWTTLDIIAYAAHKREDNGELYYMDSSGIQQLEGGEDDLTWTWQSGDIVGPYPGEKTFHEIEVIGSGSVTATVYLDGKQKAQKTLSFDMVRNRTLGLYQDNTGRALKIKLTGTGTVTEAMAHYSM